MIETTLKSVPIVAPFVILAGILFGVSNEMSLFVGYLSITALQFLAVFVLIDIAMGINELNSKIKSAKSIDSKDFTAEKIRELISTFEDIAPND